MQYIDDMRSLLERDSWSPAIFHQILAMGKTVMKARLVSSKACPVKTKGKDGGKRQSKKERLDALFMADLEQSEKTERLTEAVESVNDEMRACADSALQIFSFSNKLRKKREGEKLVHRNYGKAKDMPFYSRAKIVRAKLAKFMKKDKLDSLMDDKGKVTELYYVITKYSPLTRLDCTNISYESWGIISSEQADKEDAVNDLKKVYNKTKKWTATSTLACTVSCAPTAVKLCMQW